MSDSRFHAIRNAATYGRMIKFSHSIFALPFAISAVLLASRDAGFSIWRFLVILVAMVAARSCAMGFNRLVDRKIDGKNPRTASREIPAGAIPLPSAWLFTGISALVFVLSAALLGPLCLKLSVPVLVVLCGYSFTKRFTLLCHFYLGLAIALAPAGAWVAMTGMLSWKILFLSAALFTHIAGFDILYACQDCAFDKKEGLHSIPARLGVPRALSIARKTHMACFGFLLAFHLAFGLHLPFFLALLSIAALLAYEHKMVNPDDLSKVPAAFFNINSIISVLLFIGILLDEWLWRWTA